MKADRTWIVVANSERARVLERKGAGSQAHTFLTFSNAQKADALSGHSAPPGRVHDSHGPARHRLEPAHTARELDRYEFSRSIAKVLETYAVKSSYTRLIVIAARSTLGSLRQVYGSRTRPLISDELDKDILGFTDRKISEFLQKRLV